MAEAVVEPESDGRRARRERNRTAVVDAMFELLTEGDVPPSVDDIADRARVSVSSIFRYFENLDDLQRQTIDRYFERFAPLFDVPSTDGDLDDRIAALVDARLTLYEAIAPLARLARVRAGDQPVIAASLAETRRFHGAQLRTHFAPDLVGLARAETDDRLDLVDTLTAFEAWDLLRDTRQRSRRQIRRIWLTGVRAVLAQP
ncbi:MAG: TetR/AcrR family transcriptional regulator [Acidimicrobiales bacterium]